MNPSHAEHKNAIGLKAPVETILGFDPACDPSFSSAMLADVLAHLPEGRRPSVAFGRARAAVVVLLRSPGFRMTLLYRVSYLLRNRLGPIGRVPSAILYWIIRHHYGCSIAPTAKLHGGLIFPHPQGIVIGPDALVGPRAWIFQNVTIGGSPNREGLPTIGADARIFPGAVVVGPIQVGRNVAIGANSVVTKNVPAASRVRPASVEVMPIPETQRVGETLDKPT